MYAFGILGEGERKSAEPIAARACADPSQTNNVHSARRGPRRAAPGGGPVTEVEFFLFCPALER